jgi:hypothetical protein
MLQKTENTAAGIRHADQMALTSPTSGGRSVGLVRLRTQDTEFSFSLLGLKPATFYLVA